MKRTHGLTHIALTVRDLDRSVRFYQTLLDAKITYEDPGQVELRSAGGRDAIALIAASGSRRNQVGKAGGIQHFGFRLVKAADIDAVVKAAVRGGGKVLRRGEFGPGQPFAFFRDPDGYEVEVWYE